MALVRRVTALAIAATLAGTSPGGARQALVTAQPSPGPAVAPYVTDPAREPATSRNEIIRRLRQRVKYVFVIFNENHSFDNEFGTFPGANGLYSDGSAPRDAAHTPGFTQTYQDASGQTVTVTPFGIGPEQNASFVDSVIYGLSILTLLTRYLAHRIFHVQLRQFESIHSRYRRVQ